MHRKFSYSEPPSGFLRELAMPFEVAIHEFIDNNHEEIARRYTQSKLQRRGRPPSVEELEALEKDTETFMEDVLPSKILKAVDLDRIGYEKFISQRLSDIFLDGVVNFIFDAHFDAPMEAIAARVATKKYL